MKRIFLVLLVHAVASSAWAANVPSGLTGLWQFATDATKYQATVGTDTTSDSPSGPVYNGWYPALYTAIGTDANPTAYWDNGVIQKGSNTWLVCSHGIAPNGGGAYVNQYTFAIDYKQDSLSAFWDGNYYNSLFQTDTSNGNDGDLFIKGPDYANSVIGVGATGYSALTFDSSQWHRIVWSVDNGDADGNGGFFRVFVDGTLYLDAPGQGKDGRFSLDPTALLLADNDWEDAWGYIATAATWDRALTTDEVAGMGSTSTGLTIAVPEPGTFLLLAAGLAMVFVIRRKK